MENKIKCLECGISIPDVEYDATYEEKLCNACYEKWAGSRDKALEKAAELKGAMTIIFKQLNIMGEEEFVTNCISDIITHEHRTLQANFFRMLMGICKNYVEHAKKFGSDARNEAAVELAKKIVALDAYIPFI